MFTNKCYMKTVKCFIILCIFIFCVDTLFTNILYILVTNILHILAVANQ